MSARMGRSITSVDPLAMKYLENYDWPGNVRELQNVLERMLLVSQGSILTVDSLPREIITDHRAVGGSGGAWTSPAPGASEPAERPLDRKERKKLANEQEKKQIIDTLDECAGNVSMASAKLGISRNTMYKKMKKYNIVN
jgi:transcriptional regulator of acetoin/glycerol metabolism